MIRAIYSWLYMQITLALSQLYHLLEKTSVETKDVIETSPLKNEGFPLGWQNLEEKYENNQILINFHLNLKPVTK